MSFNHSLIEIAKTWVPIYNQYYVIWSWVLIFVVLEHLLEAFGFLPFYYIKEVTSKVYRRHHCFYHQKNILGFEYLTYSFDIPHPSSRNEDFGVLIGTSTYWHHWPAYREVNCPLCWNIFVNYIFLNEIEKSQNKRILRVSKGGGGNRALRICICYKYIISPLWLDFQFLYSDRKIIILNYFNYGLISIVFWSATSWVKFSKKMNSIFSSC